MTTWNRKHHAIAAEAMALGGNIGALGEIFANTYFIEKRACQSVATRAMSQLKKQISKQSTP